MILCQHLEDTFENSALSPPVEALVDDLPIIEALGKIAPWDARSISEKNGLDEQPIIRFSATNMAFTTGQKILDPVPLVVSVELRKISGDFGPR